VRKSLRIKHRHSWWNSVQRSDNNKPHGWKKETAELTYYRWGQLPENVWGRPCRKKNWEGKNENMGRENSSLGSGSGGEGVRMGGGSEILRFDNEARFRGSRTSRFARGRSAGGGGVVTDYSSSTLSEAQIYRWEQLRQLSIVVKAVPQEKWSELGTPESKIAAPQKDPWLRFIIVP